MPGFDPDISKLESGVGEILAKGKGRRWAPRFFTGNRPPGLINTDLRWFQNSPNYRITQSDRRMKTRSAIGWIRRYGHLLAADCGDPIEEGRLFRRRTEAYPRSDGNIYAFPPAYAQACPQQHFPKLRTPPTPGWKAPEAMIPASENFTL